MIFLLSVLYFLLLGIIRVILDTLFVQQLVSEPSRSGIVLGGAILSREEFGTLQVC